MQTWLNTFVDYSNIEKNFENDLFEDYALAELFIQNNREKKPR